MLWLIALLAAAPLQCPKGTTHAKVDGEESCRDADGQLHGPQEFRDENGVLLHRATWVHGVALSQVSFFPDGSRQMVRSWSDGKRDGAWELYDERGDVIWRREYSSGRLVKETIFGPDGAASSELTGPILKRIIGAHRGEVTFCYEKQLRQNARLAGTVTPSFTIGPDGDVTEVHFTENTVADAEVGRCIAERVKKWEFPRPPDGESLELSFPWIFKPAGAGKR